MSESVKQCNSSEWVDPDNSPSTDELLTLAMQHLAAQPSALFIGQGVEYGGVATYRHLQGIPQEQRLEFPVAEELQMGVGIGMALQGFLPILVYPRVNFLWRAADQLINHLDKLEQMSQGQFRPKLIIRTRIGSTEPLNAGPQHTGNPVNALKGLIPNVELIDIWQKQDILQAYQRAVESRHPVIVLEDLGC